MVTVREAERPRGQAQRTGWRRGAGQGTPVFSTPSSLPQSRLPAHKLCSNYTWFDNFRPGPAIKNKEEDRQRCLLTMPLIGGVNFNGPNWSSEEGIPELGRLLLSPVMLTRPFYSSASPLEGSSSRQELCLYLFILIPGAWHTVST